MYLSAHSIRVLPVILLVLLILIGGCDSPEHPNSEKETDKLTTADQVARLIEAEDLVLNLTLRLKSLGAEMVAATETIPEEFETLTSVKPLADSPWASMSKNSRPASEAGSFFDWPIAADQGNGPSHPLRPLIKQLSSSDAISFSIYSGMFKDAEHRTFEMVTGLKGKGFHDNQPLGFRGKQTLLWIKTNDEWKLNQWHSHSLEVLVSDRTCFEDVTKKSFRNEEELKAAQRSIHQEMIDAVVRTGKMPELGKYTPYIDAASPHALPCVSVVDIDGDSWEDVFISSRWGPTQLLHNNGDGTFSDRAKELGLQFPNLVNCAAFVDLDNDGDLDAVLGRSLEAAVYLRNENGVFKDVTDTKSNLFGRFMVSAISVSDINRDGLLDLYCSTYGPFGQNLPGKFIESQDWRKKFLKRSEFQTLVRKNQTGNSFVDNPGPPNFVVMNRGNGLLEALAGTELTQQWHHSYQSAWADVDNDGDDDLYIANDFAPDALLINDTPRGGSEPTFSDGLKSCFPGEPIGFGMGASWDDYDSDGDLDLYVSNMYSKAGARIIGELGEGDPRMSISTQGNFLYRNDDGQFRNITGSKAGQQDVGHVGWSYGGQFADFDNNGFSDIYVPCGFVTASSVADTEVDI